MRRLQVCFASNLALASSVLLGGCAEGPAKDAPLGSVRQALEAEVPLAFTPKSAAALTGRLAGAAVANGPLSSEPLYAQTLAAEFSDVTPENETKWGSLQPNDRKAWNFANADAIVAFAANNGMRVKGHTLAWHSQLPPFINADMNAGQLNSALTKHINETVPRYAGQMFAWDVVNEAIADDGSGLRNSILSQLMGEEFITHSFLHARAKDHGADLYYNDYSIETINAKSNAVYDLMTRLLAADVPVDGVGIQGHIDARFAPSVEDMVANFNRFGELGLSVNVSELDVRVARIAGNRNRKLAIQKQIYQRVAAACAESAACTGITTWGFTDKYSWIDSTFGEDDPLLFDEQYQKKPAYYGFIDGFVGVPLDPAGLEPNLIGNSSFEAGLDGWNVLGSGTLASSMDAHTGYHSGVVSGRTATFNGPRRDITALTQQARGYDVSVWTRIGGASAATARLTAQVTCTGQATQFIGLAQANASDTGWVQLSGMLNLPNCALQTVAVYVEGPAAGVDVYADDLAVRERPLANLVQNGTFEAGTNGWFGWGPSVIGVSSDSHSGSQAGRASGRTDTWNGIATNLTSVLQREVSYQATAFAKVAGASSAPLALTAKIRCTGGSDNFVRVASATGNSSSYSELSGSITMPNCPLAEVVLYVEGPPAGVDILLDDVSVSQLASSEGPNIIVNRDFETNTAGWFPFGSVSISASTARAHSGARSALVTGRTATFNGIATSLVGIATPGVSYRVRGFAQVSTASAPVRFTLQSACSGGAASFTTVASATANNSTWVELDGTMNVPNCTLTTANLYIEGAPAGTDIYLDDVSVRQRL